MNDGIELYALFGPLVKRVSILELQSWIAWKKGKIHQMESWHKNGLNLLFSVTKDCVLKNELHVGAP